jgi:kinetochore protein Mis12/MTW1
MALPPLNPDDSPSAQDERRLYIEGQTRRHLMRTRGLEFDDDGSVRDGEWIGGGRKVGADEVAALEEVVARLENGKEENEEERMEE